MSQTVKFPKCRMGDARYKLSKAVQGQVPVEIKLVAIMTADIAAALGHRWLLFDKEQVIKSGFASVELDLELTNLRVTIQAANLDPLDVYVDRAAKFKVYSKGDGKKKPKALMVSFVLYLIGNPFVFLEKAMAFSGAELTCRLMPRQGELFEVPAGVAESIEKTAAERGNLVKVFPGKRVSASVTVQDGGKDGFLMTCQARGFDQQFRRRAPEAFPGERDALEAGARKVHDWVTKQLKGCRVKQRKADLAELAAWCEVMLQGVIVDEATPAAVLQ